MYLSDFKNRIHGSYMEVNRKKVSSVDYGDYQDAKKLEIDEHRRYAYLHWVKNKNFLLLVFMILFISCTAMLKDGLKISTPSKKGK